MSNYFGNFNKYLVHCKHVADTIKWKCYTDWAGCVYIFMNMYIFSGKTAMILKEISKIYIIMLESSKNKTYNFFKTYYF